MAKRHAFPKSISSHGKTPFAAQHNFAQWQNATHSLSQFPAVAKRHSLPDAISPNGKLFSSDRKKAATIPLRLFLFA